jgi:DNA polymerase III delta subunit
MAAPNPERELGRLAKLLEALPDGQPHRCIVIAGASEFFRAAAVDAVLARIPEDHDRRTIDGEADRDTDGRELMGLRGGNLFGGGSVLVVRRGDPWLKRHGAGLASALASIAPGCGLLLELCKLDKRTKLARKLGEVGELFDFRELYSEPYDRSRSPLEAEMVGWIEQRSRRLGCPLTAEAAFVLMSTVGTKPAELAQELSRLRDRLGEATGKRRLTPEDLRGKLTCSFESTPFEFAEAVLALDRRRALRALTAMYRRGARSRDGGTMDAAGLYPFITSWLYQSLSQVREGCLLLDQGHPLSKIPGLVGVRVFVDRFLAQVQQNQSGRLARGLKQLVQCQRELRTTGEDPQLLLERFLSRYLAPATDNVGAVGGVRS